ncbi:MAG: MGMT family protein [Patescibacteria group bacterium]|nr:MGMT family protein [Patescibacteria group bacterium]
MNKLSSIYSAVSLIPKGKVATYKQIARITKTKSPRTVGFVLHKNPNPENIPCHRVVRSDGSLAKGYAFGGLKKQKEILQSEGITFNKNYIDLKYFQFQE